MRNDEIECALADTLMREQCLVSPRALCFNSEILAMARRSQLLIRISGPLTHSLWQEFDHYNPSHESTDVGPKCDSSTAARAARVGNSRRRAAKEL